jgi:hypothetical protein
MPRQSKAVSELSLNAKSQLALLGSHIDSAVKARGSYSDFAERVCISRGTLRKVINGSPSVPLGIFVAVLDGLGLVDHLNTVAAPEHDALGQSIRLNPKVTRDEFNGDF